MIDHDGIIIFEAARPNLLGLAYRILGSRADAEDAVQDTYLKWRTTDRDALNRPAAWLTTVCTRRCLDLLRASHRQRVDYVGAWLPEPIQMRIEADIDTKLSRASSLTMAFLFLLERLTPKERAAYILREIFDTPYAEIADVLELSEAACRKLVSRANTYVRQARVRQVTSIERQKELLAAFQAAITTGAPAKLAGLLSEDIRLAADGGGKVPTLVDTLSGKLPVLAFLVEGLHEWWRDYYWIEAYINGSPGLILSVDGIAVATVSFAYDDVGKVTDIFIVRNPDKLVHLGVVVMH